MSSGQQVSRRKILTGAAISAAAVPVMFLKDRWAFADSSGVVTSMPRATTFTSSLAARGHEVSLLSASDPGFSEKLESLYPGLSSKAEFQAIAPMAALITHQSGPTIRALTVYWSIVTQSDSTAKSVAGSTGGNHEVAKFYVAKPGTKKKGRPGRTLASGRRELLSEGESLLVAPDYELTSGAYQKNPKVNLAALAKSSSTSAFLAAKGASASGLGISLDGVVFSDRTIVGPDRYQLAKRLRVQRNAQHDEAVVIHRLAAANVSDSEIMQKLLKHSTAERTGQSGSRSWYSQARKHQAQYFMKLFQQVGRQRFAKAVASLTKMNRTKIRTIAA